MSLMCVFVRLHSLYERLTVPEENSNDDRHIKKERTNHIVNFFFVFSLCVSLSLSPFQGNTKKKKRGEKKKEAVHSPTSLSATPPYAKLSPSCFAIRSLTRIYRLRLLRCHHKFIYYFE